jgi:hypothetical protein
MPSKKSKKSAPTEFYTTQIVMSWESIEFNYFGTIIPAKTDQCMGNFFIPVFDSEEACKKHYPDAKPIKLTANSNPQPPC